MSLGSNDSSEEELIVRLPYFASSCLSPLPLLSRKFFWSEGGKNSLKDVYEPENDP
jgi:hypothetical protein